MYTEVPWTSLYVHTIARETYNRPLTDWPNLLWLVFVQTILNIFVKFIQLQNKTFLNSAITRQIPTYMCRLSLKVATTKFMLVVPWCILKTFLFYIFIQNTPLIVPWCHYDAIIVVICHDDITNCWHSFTTSDRDKHSHCQVYDIAHMQEMK